MNYQMSYITKTFLIHFTKEPLTKIVKGISDKLEAESKKIKKNNEK